MKDYFNINNMNFLLLKRPKKDAPNMRWTDFWTSSTTRRPRVYPHYSVALGYATYNPSEEVDDAMFDDSVSASSRCYVKLFKPIQ